MSINIAFISILKIKARSDCVWETDGRYYKLTALIIELNVPSATRLTAALACLLVQTSLVDVPGEAEV